MVKNENIDNLTVDSTLTDPSGTDISNIRSEAIEAYEGEINWQTPDGNTVSDIQSIADQTGNVFIRLQAGTVYSGSSTLELDPIDSNGDARTIVLDGWMAAVEHTGSSICVDILDFLDTNGDPTNGRVRIYGGTYGGAPDQPVIRSTDIFNPIIHFENIGVREGEDFNTTASDAILIRNVDLWSEVAEVHQRTAAEEEVYNVGRVDNFLHFQGAGATGGSGTQSFREATIQLMWIDAANNGNLIYCESASVNDAHIQLGGWLPEGGNGIYIDTDSAMSGGEINRLGLEGGDTNSTALKAESGPIPIIINSRVTNDDATLVDVSAAANAIQYDDDGFRDEDTGRGINIPSTANERVDLVGNLWQWLDSASLAMETPGQFASYNGSTDGMLFGYDLGSDETPHWEMQLGAAYLRDPNGIGNVLQHPEGGYPKWNTNPALFPTLSSDPGFDVDDGEATFYCSDGTSGVTGGDDDVIVAARRSGVGPVSRILFDTEPTNGTTTVSANSTSEVSTEYSAGTAFNVEFWIDSDPNGAPQVDYRLGYDDTNEVQTVIFEETNGTAVDIGYEFPETGR